MNVAVVGAGIMGCAAARELARTGHDVTLYEQFRVGHDRGSSHGRSRIVRLAYPELEFVELAKEAFKGWRELEEESGLAAADVRADAGWHAVFVGPRIGMMKILRSDESAEALRARILTWLTRQERPELADIRIVRGPADLDPKMPPFVAAFLHEMWR